MADTGNERLSPAAVEAQAILDRLEAIYQEHGSASGFRVHEEWMSTAQELKKIPATYEREDYDKILDALGEGSAKMKLREDGAFNDEVTRLLIFFTDTRDRLYPPNKAE